MVFRVRELLIRQRTQAINALRGHLSEFGQVVPQGAANTSKLIAIVEDPECGLPADAIPSLKVLVAALAQLKAEIAKLDAEITRRAKENEIACRLMTVTGIGPLIATAIATLAPPPETFRKARDFAAFDGSFSTVSPCFARLSGVYADFRQTRYHGSRRCRTRNRLPSTNRVNRCARFLASPRYRVFT
jgi:transposase